MAVRRDGCRAEGRSIAVIKELREYRRYDNVLLLAILVVELIDMWRHW